jgi:hypothetical protein
MKTPEEYIRHNTGWMTGVRSPGETKSLSSANQYKDPLTLIFEGC